MTPIENVLKKLPGAKPTGSGVVGPLPGPRGPQGQPERIRREGWAGAGPVPRRVFGRGRRGGRRLARRRLDADPRPTSPDAQAGRSRRPQTPWPIWSVSTGGGRPCGPTTTPTTNPSGWWCDWDRPDGKNIRPVARSGDAWRAGAMLGPRPLYGLSDLAATRVVVTEGEKAADAARSLGLTATSSVGGSQAAGKTDWRPLAGKTVWIQPDNDGPGRKYADTVTGLLAKLTPAPMVWVLELLALPVGGDIADGIDAHGEAAEPGVRRQQLETLAGAAEFEPATARSSRSRSRSCMSQSGGSCRPGTVTFSGGRQCLRSVHRMR